MILRILESTRPRVATCSGRNESIITASSLVYLAPMLASVRPGCGPCGSPSGWCVMRAVLDSLAAHELARRVEQHLVAVDVAVIVRRRDRVRVEVVGPRTERADHKAIALKRLVHRRRLVNPSDDRLEIVDAEGPRIEVPVPSDHVERMMVEHQLVERVVLFDEDRKVAFLVARVRARSAGGCRAPNTAHPRAAGRTRCGNAWATGRDRGSRRRRTSARPLA